jgi:hypothetical protein
LTPDEFGQWGVNATAGECWLIKETKILTKANDNLVVRLAEGVIGWFSYQQAAKRSSVYSEYLFYPPLFEIGFGRNWKITCQKNLAENARSTYDMLFENNEKSTAVALEAKFIKANTPFTGNIQNDLNKLHKIKTNSENHPSSIVPDVYEFIVGKESDINSAVQATPLMCQWDNLWRPGNDNKLSHQNAGWLIHGLGQESFRYSVAIFKYRAAWHSDEAIVDDEIGSEALTSENLPTLQTQMINVELSIACAWPIPALVAAPKQRLLRDD